MSAEGWFFLVVCPLAFLSLGAWWARNESRWIAEQKAWERTWRR